MSKKTSGKNNPPAVENILSDLIKIQSVNPPGGEIAVAQYLKNLFDNYDIPNEIIEPEPGRASFIANLGEGERKLLFLSHADVVPASEGLGFSAIFRGNQRRLCARPRRHRL